MSGSGGRSCTLKSDNLGQWNRWCSTVSCGWLHKGQASSEDMLCSESENGCLVFSVQFFNFIICFWGSHVFSASISHCPFIQPFLLAVWSDDLFCCLKCCLGVWLFLSTDLLRRMEPSIFQIKSKPLIRLIWFFHGFIFIHCPIYPVNLIMIFKEIMSWQWF